MKHMEELKALWASNCVTHKLTIKPICFPELEVLENSTLVQGRRWMNAIMKERNGKLNQFVSRYVMKPQNFFSPLQLGWTPDQVPSGWQSLIPSPCRSNPVRQRTPHAELNWLLHTFWMKKPFSGGERTGQTTTAVGRMENERMGESNDYIQIRININVSRDMFIEI